MSGKIEGQFVPRPQDLLESAAWHEAMQHTYIVSLVNFLEREHLRHGGRENGNLVAPHSQLQSGEGGGRIHPRAIQQTIDKAQRLGLIRVTPGGRRKGPSRFALTYLGVDSKKPTRDYLYVVPETTAEIREARKQPKRRSSSWTKESVPPGWRKPSGVANSRSKPAEPQPAQMVGQSAGANGRSIANSPGANGRSKPPIPAGANGRCYLEDSTREGAVVSKEVEGSEVVRRDREGFGEREAVASDPASPPVTAAGEVWSAGQSSSYGKGPNGAASEWSAGGGERPDAGTIANTGGAAFGKCGYRIKTDLGEHICGMITAAASGLCVDHLSRVRVR